jgi:hypothetical protein
MYPKCYKNSNECCTFLILGILGHRCSTEKVSHFAKVEEPKVNICKHKSTNYVNIKLGVSFLTNQTYSSSTLEYPTFEGVFYNFMDKTSIFLKFLYLGKCL